MLARTALRYLWSRPPRGASYTVVSRDVVAERFSTGSIGATFCEHSGYSSSKWVHYMDVYEDQLSKVRRQRQIVGGEVHVVELGVGDGGSLEVWKEYFGPRSNVVGVDIDPTAKRSYGPGIQVVIGSQNSEPVLEQVVQLLDDQIDVVIDDGSHRGHDQVESFEYLWPKLADGGIYIVEDLHTAYWRSFGGGVQRRGTFIEYAKSQVDDLHHWYHRRPRQTLRTEKSLNISSISFYDSIVVISKKYTVEPQRVDFGVSC